MATRRRSLSRATDRFASSTSGPRPRDSSRKRSRPCCSTIHDRCSKGSRTRGSPAGAGCRSAKGSKAARSRSSSTRSPPAARKPFTSQVCPSTTTAKRSARPLASVRRSRKSSKKITSKNLGIWKSVRQMPHFQISKFPNLPLSNPKIRHERQMVRRHQRLARPRHLHAPDLHLPFVVDVVEVDDREEARIGAAPFEVLRDVDALEERRQRLGRQPLHPFIEVAEDDLRAGNAVIVDEGRQALRLVPPLEDGGP